MFLRRCMTLRLFSRRYIGIIPGLEFLYRICSFDRHIFSRCGSCCFYLRFSRCRVVEPPATTPAPMGVG